MWSMYGNSQRRWKELVKPELNNLRQERLEKLELYSAMQAILEYIVTVLHLI